MGADRDRSQYAGLAPHRRYLPLRARDAAVPRLDGEPWGLYPGEPEACRRQVFPFLRSMVQLGLLVLLFKKFQIEGRAFLALATLALAALPVHYLAPYRWKKALFLAVSVTGLFWVFGTEVASVVLGLAALLIGICFLPVSWAPAPAAWPCWPPCLPPRSQSLFDRGPVHRLAGHCHHVHVSDDSSICMS